MKKVPETAQEVTFSAVQKRRWLRGYEFIVDGEFLFGKFRLKGLLEKQSSMGEVLVLRWRNLADSITGFPLHSMKLTRIAQLVRACDFYDRM